MLSEVDKAQMTPEKLKDYVITMKNAVVNELTKIDLEASQDLFLKARLKNYVLLEAFLDSPVKAKAALEDMIANVGRK